MGALQGVKLALTLVIMNTKILVVCLLSLFIAAQGEEFQESEVSPFTETEAARFHKGNFEELLPEKPVKSAVKTNPGNKKPTLPKLAAAKKPRGITPKVKKPTGKTQKQIIAKEKLKIEKDVRMAIRANAPKKPPLKAKPAGKVKVLVPKQNKKAFGVVKPAMKKGKALGYLKKKKFARIKKIRARAAALKMKKPKRKGLRGLEDKIYKRIKAKRGKTAKKKRVKKSAHGVGKNFAKVLKYLKKSRKKKAKKAPLLVGKNAVFRV